MQSDRSFLSFGSRNRPNPFMYNVKRNVYNEENFQQEHRKRTLSSGNVNIDITTFRHHVQCRCSWHKFLKCMLTIFPFLEWMCLYRFKDWLLGDLLAGLSVGFVQVPQGLTLSLLTRQLIPPLNVTYAAFCSSVIYVIFGSCHQMSIGPFFLVSALMIDVLKVSPFNDGHLIMGSFIKEDFTLPSFYVNYNESLSVVATTTFLTGIIQLSMAMVGMGFMATYLPEATISAYLAAVALHIILAQLTCIFGIMVSFHAGPIAFFYNIVNYCVTLPKANSTSILLFLTAIVALRINKCIRISFNQYPIEFPMELFLILGFSILANKISMSTETSQTLTSMIPYSFIFPEIPNFSRLSKILLQAMSLALVSSFLLIFLGKRIANCHHYGVNSNQDLIAIGLCNVVSSFFRSGVFSGAVARTIIQDKSGGRQQFASLVGAGVMVLLTAKMGQFFHKLPNAVLAGIILSNVLPYLETIYNLPSLWRQDQYDCVVWLVTFCSAIFLGLDIGLLISFVFTFFIIAVRSHRTKILLLGQIPNTNIYRSISDYREVLQIPGVRIFQCCSSITFVNVYHLRHKLLKEINMVRVPLKEEEIFQRFNISETHLEENHICRCYCDCEELEPPPRVLYTERFENKGAHDELSVNLIRCSFLSSKGISNNNSDEQATYEEDGEKGWPSNHPSRNSSVLPDAIEGQGQSRTVVQPYSDTTLQPNTHTIILDFSMVHYVDSRASVILRQMCNAFHKANVLVLIAGCHPSVVRALEKNDFFDEGISKAQLFLSLHDAVLFTLARKFAEPSELSVDESETVIQETYSESEKNVNRFYKTGGDLIENKRNARTSFLKTQGIADESEFDLDMDPTLVSEQDNGLDLNLDLDLDLGLDQMMDSESMLGLESKLQSETQTQVETEPEPEPEPEPERRRKSRSKPRAQTHPWQPGYRSGPSNPQPRTQSGEKRRLQPSPGPQ